MKLASQAVFAVAAAAAVVGVLYLLLSASTPSDGIEVVLATPAPSDIHDLQVYVTGAVREPGVYTVGANARLAAAVEAAGGATDEADLDAVNLAARLVDEAHWHIPTRGETAAPAQQAGKTAAGKIDINSASVESLVSLPQIGEVRAAAIVAYREANGPFASAEDILNVAGIGPATLEAIRDLIEAR